MEPQLTTIRSLSCRPSRDRPGSVSGAPPPAGPWPPPPREARARLTTLAATASLLPTAGAARGESVLDLLAVSRGGATPGRRAGSGRVSSGRGLGLLVVGRWAQIFWDLLRLPLGLIRNQEVGGSIPPRSTKPLKNLRNRARRPNPFQVRNRCKRVIFFPPRDGLPRLGGTNPEEPIASASGDKGLGQALRSDPEWVGVLGSHMGHTATAARPGTVCVSGEQRSSDGSFMPIASSGFARPWPSRPLASTLDSQRDGSVGLPPVLY